jgi:hypothetical protein
VISQGLDEGSKTHFQVKWAEAQFDETDEQFLKAGINVVNLSLEDVSKDNLDISPAGCLPKVKPSHSEY